MKRNLTQTAAAYHMGLYQGRYPRLAAVYQRWLARQGVGSSDSKALCQAFNQGQEVATLSQFRPEVDHG